jgi:hypothetical protein
LLQLLTAANGTREIPFGAAAIGSAAGSLTDIMTALLEYLIEATYTRDRKPNHGTGEHRRAPMMSQRLHWATHVALVSRSPLKPIADVQMKLRKDAPVGIMFGLDMGLRRYVDRVR